MDEEKLTNTKSCRDCYYNIKGMCFIDLHEVNIDLERAYSCKYYKYYENNKEDANE